MDKYIFYDESFSKEDNSGMVGCSAIPKEIFEKLSRRLMLDSILKYSRSFSDIVEDPFVYFYSKDLDAIELNEQNDDISLYVKWISELLSSCSNTVKTNIIMYNEDLITHYKDPGYNYLLYNKLPERVIYGILKFDSSIHRSNYNIFMDHMNKYVKFNTDTYLKDHLNALSIYRNYNYTIKTVSLISKNENYDYVIESELSECKRKIQLIEELYSKIDNLK